MRIVGPFLLVFLLVTVSLQADQLIMKSGKVYEGKVIKQDDDFVYFNSTEGDQQVSKKAVKEIVPGDLPPP